ncbi:cytochrome p450 [Trifolium pratense]|uniref:Cytochrome p450 n=1 Tax=Trifolium pratense TaxID=57577 RepID=A0A2K3NR60_TRIPR|nr:cytochrome p450 [Trifolium pratense]
MEDSLHVFFRCPNSRSIWRRANFFNVVCTVADSESNIIVVIFKILQLLTQEDAALFAIIIWSIWKQRNNKVWNNVNELQSYVFRRAIEQLHGWKAARAVQIRNKCIADLMLARGRSHQSEVHVGEALGLLSALKWVHELQLGPIDFELDSKIVVDNFPSQTYDATEFGDILRHC